VYPLNGRLDGSPSLPGRLEGHTSPLSLPEIELVSLGRAVHSLVHCTDCGAGNDRNCSGKKVGRSPKRALIACLRSGKTDR
jgi:hypothetical protein